MASSVRFYRDFLGMRASQYALCDADAGHLDLTVDPPATTIDETRRAAMDRAIEFGIRKVLPATHRQWAYALSLQDADTNVSQFEVWDEGIDPAARALAHKPTKGAK